MEIEVFGARVRRIREVRGLTLREVARRMGKGSHVSLLQLELGKRWAGRLPPLDELRALARALEISLDELVGPEVPSDEWIAPVKPEERLEDVLDRIGAWLQDDRVAIRHDQVASAGRGRYIAEGEGGPRRGRPRHARSRQLYVIRLEGNCLEPEARPGDLVVFDPERQAEPGDLVVVVDDETVIVKYLQEHQAVQYLLPLNGEPIRFIPGMRIVGVVDHFERRPRPAPGLRRRRGQIVPAAYGDDSGH